MLSTSLSMSKSNNPSSPCQTRVSPSSVRGLSFKRQKKKNNNGFVVVGCAKWDLEADMKPQEDEEKGRSGMATFRHKCGERKGVVELLECLEREAIMGEDVGKEPSDYNRRAQIFDRSSQVFQALKQLNNDVFPESSQ
ncbi:hypothetical protein JHK82_040477 [Glycine max]|nr:hypothetical protein JHK86_040668 [Glycine max]KAG4966286.1 hypothetical protein JHK85_041261 [Glycine max]KAG5111254.1 hypothetical protein JHK82_040477 [Glycine max]KAG5122541.1 hypothetical protein JHK84_040881 [Glycine max]